MSFPTINHIDDVWPHVKDRPEFILIDKGEYMAIDYVIMTPDSFSTAIERECRGIKFYPDGKIMARPFHKFFNLGEKTHPSMVDLSVPHYIQNKVDGSMIHPAILDEDRLVFMTKKGHTEVAEKAEKYFLGDPRYSEFMRGMIKVMGFTPIFEFTGPSQRIVLNYGDTHQLTLLALRVTDTGDYMPYEILERYRDLYNIPVAKRVDDLF